MEMVLVKDLLIGVGMFFVAHYRSWNVFCSSCTNILSIKWSVFKD